MLSIIGRPYGWKKYVSAEEQNRFTAGSSGSDNIFLLKQITEKIKSKILRHQTFTNLEKTFNIVPVKRPLQILDETNFHKHCVHIIIEIFKNQTNVIKVANKSSAIYIRDVAFKLTTIKCCCQLFKNTSGEHMWMEE